jgi:hypothetical protein
MFTDGKRMMTVGAAVKAMACALCLATTTVAGLETSHAEETSDLVLTPLRDNQEVLQHIVHMVQRLGEVQWRSYELPTHSEFQVVMPSVIGVASLSQSGIAMKQGDEASLVRYVLAATTSRVQELGVSDGIAVRYPEDWNDEANCDQLRINFAIESREFELKQGRAIVVVITMVSMQPARDVKPDHTTDCLDGRYPPRMMRDTSRIFLLEDDDRERALEAIRRELLSMIDYAVVGRIATSNHRALKTIYAWTASGN